MNTFELQYGQVNNVLMSFNTSNLPVGLFSSFKREKLEVYSSNRFINNALDVNLHEKTIIVKIDWGKYIMKQEREVFILNVKYNNRAVDSLAFKFQVNFKKKNASTKLSISQTQVLWNKDMYVDLIIEPTHSQSEKWKFLSGTKVVKFPLGSKFKPVDGENEVHFNVLEKQKITLKYEHSLPIMPPITKDLSEKIIVMIGSESSSFDVTLVPNNSPSYRINVIRLTPSYTIGCNELDLWKLQIIDENPYAFLSINDVITDSDKLKIKALNEHEWLISLKSVKMFKKLPSSSILANVEVQASRTSSKKIGLILSTIPNDDVHYINIKEENCLQFNVQNEARSPFVVYRDNSSQQILLNLKNLSHTVVEDIIISSSNDNVQIAESSRHIKTLKPNHSIPVSVKLNSNLSVGLVRATIQAVGDYTKKCSYDLHYEIKEKKHCTLNVEIVKNSFVETFAGEEYTNHKVCEIMLTACMDENYGTVGSLPIVVSDIKASQLFSIRTNIAQIEPGKTLKCDLVLNGTIGHGEEVNDFNKLIAFKYEHK
ncbi:MAG: hypothetical protein J6V44_00425 [Methanobrevibacter sp.]|nr:hypothetical protein [Methanobrevibacter sp.]